MILYGEGLFWVIQNRYDPAKLAVEIQITSPAGSGRRVLRLSLAQRLVDRIEKHPDLKVADFFCRSYI